MTHHDKLQKIREACIEANPDIVALKPNCIVNLAASDGYTYTVVANTYVCQKHKTGRACSVWQEKNEDYCPGIVPAVTLLYQDDEEGDHLLDWEVSKIKRWEIEGRPITLADVLLAMGYREDVTLMVTEEKAGSRGIFLELKRMVNTQGYYDAVYWDLRKENLSEQSEEMINFLYDLLS